MPKANQPDLFTSDAEPDLFGAPAPQAYEPDPAHVRNRLQALLTQMETSAAWPWDAAIVSLHRERSFAYLCGLLPADEATLWRARIEAEVGRLDEADIKQAS